MSFNATARTNESNVSVLDPLANQARESLRELAAAVAQLEQRIDGSFGNAVRLLARVTGHVVIIGVGKSGLIGRKIAATFASTGTPSFFVHAAEAFHGDLGMITSNDAVILISYSGRTEEVTRLLPHLRERGVRTLALVGDLSSVLGREANVVLDVSVEREVCPNNLAPTSSTLATLAMGDALAVSLMRMQGFHKDDFARLHPGGSLGRRLSRVGDAMSREPMPIVRLGTPIRECVLAMATSCMSFVLVLDGDRLRGIISERELRKGMDNLDATVDTIMATDPPVVSVDMLVADAEVELAASPFGALIVIDEAGHVCGSFPRPSE